MLNIYTSKDKIPSNKEYIYDNESYFVTNIVEDNEHNRDIISQIDKGVYVNSSMFKDRLGRLISMDFLSMSSKILINIFNADNKYVFNCSELGSNAFSMLVGFNVDGDICFPKGLFYEIPDYVDLSSLMCNGKPVKCIDDFGGVDND